MENGDDDDDDNDNDEDTDDNYGDEDDNDDDDDKNNIYQEKGQQTCVDEGHGPFLFTINQSNIKEGLLLYGPVGLTQSIK